jgi:3-methyl-2-oxobutanoate hydroxymethyltransferase
MSTTAPAGPTRRVTAPSLRAMKESGQRIVMVTAFDHPGARLAEAAGVDAVLVGDSLGMTVLGHSSTLPVTMEERRPSRSRTSRRASRQ